MSSLLPAISVTHIAIPKPAPRSVSRTLNVAKTRRAMTADMPRGAKPAPVVPSRDFTLISSQDRASLGYKMDNLLMGASFNLIEFDEIPNLVVLLKERRRKAILMGEYQISQKAEDLIKYIASMKLQRTFKTFKVVELKELNEQLTRAENQLEVIKAKWDRQVAAFNESQHAAARRLEQEQLRRLEEFDAEVPSDLPAGYCKLSGDLLNLREQERQLVLCRRYDEALKVRTEAEGREIEEGEVQKTRFLEMINGRKRKILDTQKSAVECFQVRWARIEDKLNKEMQAEIATQEKFIINMKLKIRDASSEEIVA
jgi:hypothetical protein